MNFGVSVSPRVNQLDASLLDSELVTQFKDQLIAAFKYWHPEIKDKYESELMLVLRTLLFKVTIWDNSTTYGAKLQNLILVNSKTNKVISRKTKALYGSIVILLPYLWKKLRNRDLISTNLQDKLNVLMNSVGLLNFVSFLFSGNYLTVIMRVLGIKYFSASGSQKSMRNVNYEFQNRQLVWNALTEFLLFLLPIINVKRLYRTVVKPWLNNSADSKSEYSFLSRRLCAICFQQDSTVAINGVTNPYTAGCEHAYCYVCLARRLAEHPGWNCLRCNKQLHADLLTPFGE